MALDNGSITEWRIKTLEKNVADLQATKPDVLAERVNTLADDVRSLKRAFYTFAFSVVLASLVFAGTFIQYTGS